jgi:DNA polymerase elongation subunit (family B)
MTYISAQITETRQSVIVWERDSQGRRDFRSFVAPHYFYYEDEDGDYTNIYGKKLSKVEFARSRECREAREEAQASGTKLYESDIAPEYKILSEYYYNKPSGNLNITFLDIETDKDPDRPFATIDEPYAPIISVAIYHQYNNRMVVYAIPPTPHEPNPGECEHWTEEMIPSELRELAEINLCSSEEELLLCLLEEIDNSDILCGWNSEFFDLPYIYMRLMKLGPQFAQRLSFPDARPPRVKEVEKFKVIHKTVEIFGRVALDYLPLFKKLDSRMRQSYKLEAIAEEELKDLEKLKYSGALSDLYRKDFIYFLRYNIRDTEILKGLEEKLKYIDFAITFSHMATCQVDDVLGTIKPSDMTIINYCHYVMNQKVPDGNRENTREGQYAGALVLDPQTGLCEMGSAIDIVSLYPSAERALNISPETMRGQFVKKHIAWEALFYENDVQLELLYENGFSETRSAKEWRVELISRNWCVSGYGTCYTQEFMGFIPAILTEWFQKRKEFKGLMKKAAKDMAAAEPGSPDYITAQNAMNYFDRMQYVMKIRLNSIYGAQGNPFFRFYDVRSAESTTRSGQQILLHQVRKIALELDGEYVYPSSSIIYGDTDSCYFKCHTTDVNDAIEVAKTVNELVNGSFPEFLAKAFLCNDQFNTMINAEYEFIFDAGVFVKKKLYALHLVYDGGKAVDKLKIMGLQLKKTTIPKPVSKKLIGFLEDLLKGKDFNTTGAQLVRYRDELFNTEDILSIGLPKGIKGIEDYTERYNIDQGCKIPGHVAAAMLWNKCLAEYNDNLSEKIMTGGKIRVFYLTKTFGRFKSIAVPTDVVELPVWFKEHFYKLVDRKAQVQRLVDDPLKGIFQSMGEKMPTKKSLFVDELVEY